MGKKIGITGGIGAGKSVVSRVLRLQGFPVYDCDSAASHLMENDLRLKSKLKEILGEEAYSGNRLNREYVADKIFGNREMREEVNKNVHAAVREDFRRYCDGKEGTVFIESAILSTGGLTPMIDEVWMVEAGEDERISRVKKRNGLDEEKIKARMEAQRKEFEGLPPEKTRRINNDGENSLLLSIENLLQPSVREEGGRRFEKEKLTTIIR